jgi:hypothetical protein
MKPITVFNDEVIIMKTVPIVYPGPCPNVCHPGMLWRHLLFGQAGGHPPARRR